MPTALVGSVVLTCRGRGIGQQELYRRIEELIQRIKRSGGRVADFASMSLPEIIDRACNILKGVVGQSHDLLEPTYYPIDRFQLSFHRNQIVHLFVSEAIIAAAMYVKIKEGDEPDNQRVERGFLVQQVSFLSKLMRNEFVFDISGLRANMEHSLQRLHDDDVLHVTDEFVELSVKERKKGCVQYDFYRFLIWPFVESYWVAALALFALLPPEGQAHNGRWVQMSAFQEAAQLFAKTLYAQGDVTYLEAVNKETLKTAFASFEEEGMLVVEGGRRGREKREKRVMLSPAWLDPGRQEGLRADDSSQSAPNLLWAFVERIGGRSRGDAAAASGILRLAQNCGAGLKREEDSASNSTSSTSSTSSSTRGDRNSRARL